MVIDIGGTTTDVGRLKLGFPPRGFNSVVKVGGVRTLFCARSIFTVHLAWAAAVM